MKKFLFSLFAIAFLIGGGVAFAEYKEGSFANTKEEHPGPASNPVRVYTLVRYPDLGATGTQTALTNGDVVIWDLVSDDGVTVNLIGEGGAVSNDAVAGVVVGDILTPEVNGNTAVQDLGKRNWGYIQVYGLHTSTKVDASTITVGTGLTTSATARRAGTARAGGALNGGATLGFAYDTSSASAENAEVFVRTR